MGNLQSIVTVALVGLFTTSAVIVGATLGLYLHLSKNVLAAVLAFAAGVLISSLGIELAYQSAVGLYEKGFSILGAWAFVSGGFAVGATVYFTATRFLDRRGAAVRSATRFAEYALERRQEDIELLSKVDLLRHLPPQAIESLLTNGGAFVDLALAELGERGFVDGSDRIERCRQRGGVA